MRLVKLSAPQIAEFAEASRWKSIQHSQSRTAHFKGAADAAREHRTTHHRDLEAKDDY